MHADGLCSHTPPNQVRRRYNANRRRPQFSSDHSLDAKEALELSVHLPREPRGYNRFEVLRHQSPSPRKRDDDYRSSVYSNRSRYGRGSREGKRRRDARRTRRRSAAVQMLDQQLSRDFDRTLTQANVYASLPHKPPRPAFVHPTIESPSSNTISTQPGKPWFPCLHFGGLDLMNKMPQLSQTESRLKPPKAPSLPPELPSWCPALPSLVESYAKRSELPLFFDLSKFPERFNLANPSPRSQELQFWRPSIKPKGKTQSRFFPSPICPTPISQPLSTACRLHDSERSVRDAATQTIENGKSACKGSAQAATVIQEMSCDMPSEPTAANLWRILRVPQQEGQNARCDPSIDNFACDLNGDDSADDYRALGQSAEAVRTPAELDNTETPFVHANSLTGHANECAEFTIPDPDESVLCDTPATMTPIDKLLFGMNEHVVDHYKEESYADAMLAALDLPPLPPSPSPELHSLVLPAALPAICETVEIEPESFESDAHFKSEQGLFEPLSPTTITTNRRAVNDTASLMVEHPPECWCEDCNDSLDLICSESVSDEDDWMDLSKLERSRSPSVMSEWESEWGVLIIEEDEKEDATWVVHWDDFLVCAPSLLGHGAW